MWYQEFRFENFKGIGNLTLPLTGDVTTLIGLNESGKTTILEAIFCFSYGAENLDAINPSMASLRNPEHWVPIAKRGNFTDSISISAVVGLSDDDKRDYRKAMLKEFGLTVSSVPDELKITERYKFEASRYQTIGRTWDLKVSGTKLRQRTVRKYGGEEAEWSGAVKWFIERLPRIWYFPNFLFELPDRFMLGEQATASAGEESDKNRFYKSTFEQVLNQLGTKANLDTHVVGRLASADEVDQRSLKAVLLGMGQVVTRKVFEQWDRIFGQAPTAQEIELDAKVNSAGDPFLELKIKGADGYYDLSERSLGFRWFFMFLLMTSFHGFEEDGSQPLFLLDEPASNLHSSAQAELLKSFATLAENCKLVYTTHSHHLINVRWLDSAYVVKNDALGTLDLKDYLMTQVGGRTSISATPYRRFVNDHPNQTSYFQPVLDLLEYKPSILEPIPDVVMVEGKSDFYLLRYATDVLGISTDVRLIPGGGAGSLDPLIRLHIGWGKSFVVLLDGDRQGRIQRDRYQSEFGPMLGTRCVLLPDLCEEDSVKECEDILTKDDRKNLVDAVFTGAAPRPTEKKALRQAIVELLARGQVVELDADTRERLSSILDGLRTALTDQGAASAPSTSGDVA